VALRAGSPYLRAVQFIVALILFVVVAGIADARLPWPRDRSRR
jgi:hypothetical protein